MYVHIQGLNFSYQRSAGRTVAELNLDISQGEVVAILGESGSGKSTILRLLAGLEVPQSGTITIRDQIMVDSDTFVHSEHRGIGMVFQDYALFPHMTVAGNIKFGLKGLSAREKDRRVSEMLALVNLMEYKDRYPYELSGGQQQRVALARALAPKPSLLLMDEPFSNLDKALQTKIRDELKAIIKEAGTTTIFVTHDVDDAKALADRVVTLKRGEMVAEEAC